MSVIKIKHSSNVQNATVVILEILSRNKLPLSAREIYLKLKSQHFVLREDEVIRLLRNLSEENQVRHHIANRWSVIAPVSMPPRQSFSPPPRLSELAKESLAAPIKDDEDQMQGRWEVFRRLCSYYMDCLLYTENPRIALIDEEREKTWNFIQHTIDWANLDKLEKQYSIAIASEAGLLHILKPQGRQGDCVFLGYPCALWPDEDSSESSITPLFLQPMSITSKQGSYYLQPLGSLMVNQAWLDKEYRKSIDKKLLCEHFGLSSLSFEDDEDHETACLEHVGFLEVVNKLKLWPSLKLRQKLNPNERSAPVSSKPDLQKGIYNWSVLHRMKAELEQLKEEIKIKRDIRDEIHLELKRLESEQKIQLDLRGDLIKLEEDITKRTEEKKQLEEALLQGLNALRQAEEEKNSCEEKKCAFEGDVQKIQSEFEATKKEYDALKVNMSSLAEQQKICQAELNSLENRIKESSDKKEELEKALQQTLETVRQVEEDKNFCEEKKCVLERDAKQLQSQNERYLLVKEELEPKVNALRHDFETLEIKSRSLKEEIARLEKEKNEMIERKNDAYLETSKLKSEGDFYQQASIALKNPPKVDERNFSDLERPYFNPKRNSAPRKSEQEALQELNSWLKKCELTYSTRLIYSFHTSLKINDISPLVVLSGTSGTGKSELPRQYAQAMGIHFLNMAVQPRWDSPQDIFGFYNYLEKQYKATDLTRAVLQAERYNRDSWPILQQETPAYPVLKDQMLLILFDEMNLARVEYYFSDFLSKLEMRRGFDPKKDSAKRQDAEISIEAGAGYNMKVYVDRNVLMVGTMNEDESTQSLSDKVLDRANTLRFGGPKNPSTSSPRYDTAKVSDALSFDTWWSWEQKPLQNNDLKQIKEWIGRLNGAMQELGRPFGHRVSQAMTSYVANYPRSGTTVDLYNAFSDQIELRIMPKLRNIVIHEDASKKAFEEIEKVIGEAGDDDLHKAFERACE